jgi:hypothetical protein
VGGLWRGSCLHDREIERLLLQNRPYCYCSFCLTKKNQKVKACRARPQPAEAEEGRPQRPTLAYFAAQNKLANTFKSAHTRLLSCRHEWDVNMLKQYFVRTLHTASGYPVSGLKGHLAKRHAGSDRPLISRRNGIFVLQRNCDAALLLIALPPLQYTSN